ncbi:MAG: GxxExxY protein [Planctomycetaceae bacterium]|nr:GxxExxY protein [Planctomycetaceae bacterium]
MVAEPSDWVDQLARAVIGAAIEVHKVLGAGFLESVYEEALCIELALRGVAFERQKPIALTYKGQPVGEARLDLLVGGELILELKAVERIHPIHKAQVINYLRATGCQLGLLLNFNVEQMREGIDRIILTQ